MTSTNAQPTFKHAVFGLGRIGLPLFACLHRLYGKFRDTNFVVGVDSDADTVKAINDGQNIFSDERGLHFNLQEALNAKGKAVLPHMTDWCDADVIWICVPSPHEDPTSYVNSVLLSIQSMWTRSDTGLVIIRSTLPTGSTHTLQETYETLPLAYCPEFTVQGDAVKGILNPSRFVIGVSNDEVWERVHRFGITKPFEEPNTYLSKVFLMSSDGAESVKLMANNLLAARLNVLNKHTAILHSLMSEAGCLSSDIHREIDKVTEAVGADPRIGSDYLTPSFAFGGGCLPKDLLNAASVEEQKLDTYLFENLHIDNTDTCYYWAKRIFSENLAFGNMNIVLIGDHFSDGTVSTVGSPTKMLKHFLLELTANASVGCEATCPQILTANTLEELQALEEKNGDCYLVPCRRSAMTPRMVDYLKKAGDRVFDLTFSLTM